MKTAFDPGASLVAIKFAVQESDTTMLMKLQLPVNKKSDVHCVEITGITGASILPFN